MKRRILPILLTLSLLLSACGPQPAPTETAAPPFESTAAETPAPTAADPAETTALGNEYVHTGGRDAVGENGVVATGREDATQIGIDILKAGGNAIDAAVAIGFALGVSEQQSSGIGGGGFMTVRFAQTGEVVFIDFRDISGAGARLDLYELLENKKEQ